MHAPIRTEAELAAALSALVAADPRLAAVLERTGMPPLRRRPAGFAGLAAIVVSQQISTTSAAAIWARLAAAYDPLEPAALRRAHPARLKRIGLSAAKIRTLKGVAAAIEAGAIDLDALAVTPAEEAYARLTALPGIGPWTADSYLLFCLGHGDAWPAADVALREAVRLAFALDARPSVRDMEPLAAPWRPWRAVAARLLWAYYRAAKGRNVAPIQPAT